jgi:hypothetical protein
VDQAVDLDGSGYAQRVALTAEMISSRIMQR